MKGSLFLMAVSLFFASCTSDNDMHYKDKENKVEVEAENPVGIQNVNGNIPDTINTLDISHPGQSDPPAARHNGEKKEGESGASFAR